MDGVRRESDLDQRRDFRDICAIAAFGCCSFCYRKNIFFTNFFVLALFWFCKILNNSKHSVKMVSS